MREEASLTEANEEDGTVEEGEWMQGREGFECGEGEDSHD